MEKLSGSSAACTTWTGCRRRVHRRPEARANAVAEAMRLGIPIMGMTDTNCDPTIEYVIPSNDDAIRSVRIARHRRADSPAGGARGPRWPRSSRRPRCRRRWTPLSSRRKRRAAGGEAPLEPEPEEADTRRSRGAPDAQSSGEEPRAPDAVWRATGETLVSCGGAARLPPPCRRAGPGGRSGPQTGRSKRICDDQPKT